MTQLFSNNDSTEIVDAILTATGVITIADGGAFTTPLGIDYELLTLHDATYSKWEVISMDSRVGAVLTVGRGVEGTQQDWPANTYISANVTAKTLADIVADIESTTSVANSASIKADSALTQIENINAGAGSGGAMDRLDQEVKQVMSAGDLIGESYYTIRHAIGSDRGLGLPDDQVDNNLVNPTPIMGYCRAEWNGVLVWRNGLLQQMFKSHNMHDWIDNNATDWYFAQIIGPRNIRFWPQLEPDETIIIWAPRAYWVDEVEVDNGYYGEYSSTGVQYSYICGGRVISSNTVNYVHAFDWASFTSQVSTAAGTMTSVYEFGSGGTSNSAGLIFFFGGGFGRTIIEKLSVSPSVTAMVHVSSTVNTISFGDTFTDKLLSWIVGYGGSDSSNLMAEFDMTTDVTSNIATTVVGSSTRNLTSFCDETYGSIFNTYDVSGVAPEGQFQKFTCATEAITAPANMGYSKADGSAALLFRNGSAFIWNGTNTGTIYTWNTSIETIALVQADMWNSSPYGENAHQVVCDGEHQAQSMINAMMFSTTGAVTTQRHRVFQDEDTAVSKIENPVGSATDYWSAS